MRKLKHITFLSFIFAITVAFNFQHNPPSNWTQQFLPNIGSRQITDMTFKDSLTGYLVANSTTDTNYILKTTNGGDNWEIVYRKFIALTKIQFLNSNVGYTCGSYLFKTTNGGGNWVQLNTPGISAEAMHVLNQDTIFLVDHNSLVGGIYRTTNSGLNWTQQLNAGSQNPSNIYFYDKKLGFASNRQGGKLYRTTNAGENWIYIKDESFFDMEFADSLTGWLTIGNRSDTSIQKTTNGGLNWFSQKTPYGGSPNVLMDGMFQFSVISKDTLWGSGGFIFYPNNRVKAVLYHTTNGGTNWLYQVPDTNINKAYYLINFTDKNHGWAYDFASGGIHTNTGGDTTFLTKIGETISEVPKLFALKQNYPNPFNPTTKINYELRIANYVALKVFDLNGKEVAALVNKKQPAGSYSVEFNAENLSSGIYFYTLTTENFKETKKMILIK